jgi:hypothetical protein
MKTYRNLAIICGCLVILFTGVLGYTIRLNYSVNKQIDTFKYAGYESDDTNYVNGQILLPDGLHSDTLVVTNAPYLNECLARPDVGSDGDIMEILNETCTRIQDLDSAMIERNR